uniref:Latent-transforming growth factor beta-binding protein 1 n=1 Tax=Astyanax mexicanus TaxID=7994 RepID=A0A8B9JTQ2_ASTMX
MQQLYFTLLFVQLFLSHCLSGLPFPGANLTAGVDRIKIIFTPMVCRRTCSGGRCYNSCERGDKTTVYSENQGPAPKSQGFRLFFCQIPCLNGGRCIGQNECWCPSNSTGKFCHLPAPAPSKATPSRRANSNGAQNGSSHSMYTLPLSNQQASMLPSLVNVHVQHPPEAEVQIHQVARVKPGQPPDGAHSVQQRSQPVNGNGNGVGNGNDHYGVHVNGQNNGHSHQRPHNRHNGYVGRCFQETVDGKCGKPLPGLTKQEDCCGSVGASWGLNKCTECPSKPAYAVIANGQVECPKGYKRMNSTHCQDINECLMPSICKHAECLNTKGSYRCTCKPGYMLDPARSHCVSDKAVSMNKDSCYRTVSAGTCGLPLTLKITKQICCCSRVGKAWGTNCEKCPVPDSDHFKEICPAGHGYTYSRSDVQITLRELEDEELSRVESFFPQIPTYPLPDQIPLEPPHHSPQIPVSPRPPYHHPQTPTRPQPQPGQPPRTAQVPHHPWTDFQHPVHCSLTPTICGPGQCVSVQTGYTCYCDPGYKLNGLQTTCIDRQKQLLNFLPVTVHEINFTDINECAIPNKCPNGVCVNTEGSFTCECKNGFTKNWRGQCEDVDECRSPSVCPGGICVNTQGSFQCQACGPGFKPAGGRCLDINECQAAGMCANGRCVNTEGSFICTCNHGYQTTARNNSCQDVNECLLPDACPHGTCVNLPGSHRCRCYTGYQSSPDGKGCEDIDECQSPEVCPQSGCTNTEGSYSCMNCDPGYRLSSDRHTCEDVNECEDMAVCPNGHCINTAGSFHCDCPVGFELMDTDCRDIDECEDENICGKNGYCENTDGSYRCQCDRGYTNPPEGQGCIDVNECETSSDLCGEALCENAEGSFLCICPNENEEFDPVASQCSLLFVRHADIMQKECYYNLNDANLCENVLSHNATKQECCCTVGAGWGDNCEIHPCPVKGQAEYDWLCPRGSGLLSVVSSVQGYNVDECEMFGPEICKNGICSNYYSTFSCFCRNGYYYDNIRMACVDHDECKEENLCEHGKCVNTDGSFNCFCSPPLVLDGTQRNCISINNTDDEDVHTDICWQQVKQEICSDPMVGFPTTYTECCCLYGVAWGSQCAFCPKKTSEHFAVLCNLPHRGTESLRERPSFEYGPYEPPYWDNYGFEGLRAEECGILNGCENGRCVRVREGYTCDCFDGYELDLSKMACIDINECKDISDSVELCKNGICSNTEGSYKCTCLPGFVASSKPHECIPEVQPPAPHAEGK